MSLRFRIVAAIVLVLVLGSGLGLALAGLQARHWLHGELVSAQGSGELAVTRAYADLKHSDRPAQDLRDLIATFDGNRHLQALLVGPSGQVLAVSHPDPGRGPAGLVRAPAAQGDRAVAAAGCPAWAAKRRWS